VDNLTSRNYSYHIISFSTSEITNEENTVKPLLAYLNNSDYYKKIQKVYYENLKAKMTQNDTIIAQIDGVLNSFSKKVNGAQNSDKLVYYNESTQLDDVIKTKDFLITEQGNKRLELVNIDKIIKDSSTTINIKNNKGIGGKMKLVLPMLFLFLFVAISFFISFYKRQLAKSKA
jgi:hypothetical protein